MKIKSKLIPLNKLFEIKHGSKLDLNKMQKTNSTDNAIAFIGRSGENNGIVSYVEILNDIEPFAKGCITVALGGLTLASFIQMKPFYTAQNIDVLTPLTEMSFDVKLYYCLCIEANRFRYSTFGREANRTLKTLLLPDIDSIPKWVNDVSKEALNSLKEDLSIVFKNSI